MIDKFIFAGDLHKKIIDPTTIIGYRECCYVTQKSFMQLVKESGCTGIVLLGDWYDRGFHTDNASSIPEYDMDIEMAKLVNNKLYTVVGNHIRLGLDSNPELFLIQPHPFYKTRDRIYRDYQIFKTPEVIRSGDVQISLLHFNHERKTLNGYKPIKQPWAKYHIAVFHTPWIIPNQQLLKFGLSVNTFTNESIGNCLEGVDLAICGDIHDPIGKFVVNHQHGSTIMVVPGSLSNTTSDPNHRHSSVYLPMITINDDSSVSLEFKLFDLNINLLTFKDIEKKKKEEQKLEGIRKKRKVGSVESGEVRSVFDMNAPDAYSLSGLIHRMNYTTADINMIKAILSNPMDVTTVVKLYHEEEDVPAL